MISGMVVSVITGPSLRDVVKRCASCKVVGMIWRKRDIRDGEMLRESIKKQNGSM